MDAHHSHSHARRLVTHSAQYGNALSRSLATSVDDVADGNECDAVQTRERKSVVNHEALLRHVSSLPDPPRLARSNFRKCNLSKGSRFGCSGWGAWAGRCVKP
jgi:hypothetical protein